MTASGILLEVKRFSVHDGPGVRTTLFLKGCSLRCRWCHNPESIAPQPQQAYYSHKCINCGECVPVCPAEAHTLTDGIHHFDREKCLTCGECQTACLGNALRLHGKKITVEEALKLVLEDQDFYRTEGGVTLSGGEPLIQPKFCFELLTALKRKGINTALDTCGCVDWAAIEKVMPETDMFLFDFKHADSATHRMLTGQGNELIIANLQRLSDCGAKIEIRIPLVPGCNDSDANLQATGKLLSRLQLKKVKVLPYHAMARSKYLALGMDDTTPQIDHSAETAMLRALTILRENGVNAISGRE